MDTVSFPEDGKPTVGNIVSVLHCALQAIPIVLANSTLAFVMEVSTETCKNSFSTLKSIWLWARYHMLLKTQGPLSLKGTQTRVIRWMDILMKTQFPATQPWALMMHSIQSKFGFLCVFLCVNIVLPGALSISSFLLIFTDTNSFFRYSLSFVVFG